MKTQQDLLYRVEAPAPRGEEFASIAALDKWLHAKMLDTDWWDERFPCVRGIYVPDVHRRNGDGSVGAWFADDCTGQIEMHRQHWCEKYVCHEVAHVCATSTDTESHGHDPLFASIYLELVYRTMGADAWVDLRARFAESGIEFG